MIAVDHHGQVIKFIYFLLIDEAQSPALGGSPGDKQENSLGRKIQWWEGKFPQGCSPAVWK